MKSLTIEFLEYIICTASILPVEHKAVSQLLRFSEKKTKIIVLLLISRMLKREEPDYNHDNLQELLALPKVFIFFLIFGSPEENNVRVFFYKFFKSS